MSKNIEINIKKTKTTFIDGRTGKELTKEQWQQRYGKIKPNLQDKGQPREDDKQNGSNKETQGTKGVDEKNS